MPDITFAPARGAATRLTVVASPRPGATTVLGVPAGMAPKAMLKLTRVVFYPVPDSIDFADLMALRDGAIVTDRGATGGHAGT